MRLLKGWCLLVAGAACILFGLLAAASEAFDWQIPLGGGFHVPQSLIVAGVFIVAGGLLFANGLMGIDPD
jgi:hypothetical protein